MNQHTLDVLEYEKVKEILVSYATSGLGKNLAQKIRPLTDRPRIERLIAETTELKTLLAPDRWLPLGGLHDLAPLLDKLDDGEEILITEEILSIKETLRAGRNIKGFIADAVGKQKSVPFAHLMRLAESIRLYPEIEARIERTFGASGEMLNSASPELKSLRRKTETLRGRVRSKLQGILRSKSVNPYLQSAVVHERKGRPVIAVQERHASRIPGARRDKSDSGNTIFIEPEGIRGMGDELEDALNAEKAEMTRILSEITAMIAKETKPLRQTLKVLAHIDLTYAKVCFSRHFEMNPPRLNTEGLIELKGARHPLLLALQRAEQKQEIFTTEVVPIDFRLGDDFQTLIITGPNTGGKTVTLKTVGLLILMAQSGLHIPAGENSKLTICQHIFADIGDEQSLEMSLSTFSSHLKNIAEILAAADKTSLVLLDELGGGTDPAEGAALGESIIKYLHSRRVRTVVTTHISPLKNLGYTVQGIENASVQFDLETLRPTYKLLIGTPGSSNALAIAKRLGLPHRVIKEAEKGSVREDEGVSALINQLQAAKSIADENRYAAEGAKAEALRLEAEYRQKLAHLSARETEMRDQLSAEAFTELRTVKNRLDRLRHTHASAKSLLKSLDEISAELANTLNESPEEKQRLEFIETLKPGDSVLVRSLNRAGTLNRIDASGDQAVVQFGVMQMTVSLADVEIS